MENSRSPMIVAAIVALLIGGVIGHAIGKGSSNEESSTTNTNHMDSAPVTSTSAKAETLRVNLRSLYQQHVDLAVAATKAGFDGKAEFDAAAKALDANSVALSKAVGSVYGAEAEKQFLAIWRSHIGFFVDYTVAAKGGDQAGMDKAVNNLMTYVKDISAFLSSANPNLPRETLEKVVTDHVLQLKGAVDAYGAKDYTKSFALQNEAYEHMGIIGDTVAGAIAKQFPDKFK